jgi:hypothetical protein
MLRALNLYAIFFGLFALLKNKKKFGPYEMGALGAGLTRLVVGPTLGKVPIQNTSGGSSVLHEGQVTQVSMSDTLEG